MRHLILLVAVLLVAFGLACVGYAKPDTADFRPAWAADHDLPAPSDQIIWLGAGALTVGAFATGATMSKKPKYKKA